MDDDTVLQLVTALAAHVRAHPTASDTAAGIAQWWLGAPVAQFDVEQALQILVDQRVMEAVGAADGRLRYRRIANDTTLDALIGAPPQPRAGAPDGGDGDDRAPSAAPGGARR